MFNPMRISLNCFQLVKPVKELDAMFSFRNNNLLLCTELMACDVTAPPVRVVLLVYWPGRPCGRWLPPAPDAVSVNNELRRTDTPRC